MFLSCYKLICCGGHSIASCSLRVLASLTARKNVVSGAISCSSKLHCVENLTSQWSALEHNASTFVYCLAPMKRTFSVQNPPGFSLHIFFSSCKSTQELGSLRGGCWQSWKIQGKSRHSGKIQPIAGLVAMTLCRSSYRELLVKE